jgi:3-deoxy-D-manno-octulosonic-acid transferase
MPLILKPRRSLGKEPAERFPERLGHAGKPRPDGPLMWVHAASVGESLSVLPLIARLTANHPKLNVLITTGTVTSAALIAERLPPRALHQFVPVDTPAAVRRFLDHWRPDAALWVESELWPNLLAALDRRHITRTLVNGRMSAGSFARWRYLLGTVRGMIAGFAVCLAQTEADAERFAELGARNARFVGDLKAVADLPEAEPAALAALSAAIAGRPVWIAASTHEGEEALALRVHRRLESGAPGLLSVIVPRHPVRGDQIVAELEGLGAKVARRSRGELPDAQTAVFLGDTMGEMGLYLKLGSVVFVGKSLLHDGGHNPREPARLGRAVLFGPGMTNFVDAAAALTVAGAAIEVADEDSLAEAVADLLADPAKCQAMGDAAMAIAEREAAGVLDRVEAALMPIAEFLGDARA